VEGFQTQYLGEPGRKSNGRRRLKTPAVLEALRSCRKKPCSSCRKKPWKPGRFLVSSFEREKGCGDCSNKANAEEREWSVSSYGGYLNLGKRKKV